jgi:hypothetical protein
MLVIALATGMASHARQVKGDDPDEKGFPGPPGWGLCVGLTTPHRKNNLFRNPTTSLGRIRWLGHVQRMGVGAMPRKMMEQTLFTGRRRGRPCLRRMDDVVADLKVMKIKQCIEKTNDREQWRLS